jgi:hypothetical protein
MHVMMARPVGGGTCGNLRDAAAVVTSVRMCASYAWSKGNKGFCVFSGAQCFTSADFTQAYKNAEGVSCSQTNSMECFSFDSSQTQARRMDQESDLASQQQSHGRRALEVVGVHTVLNC